MRLLIRDDDTCAFTRPEELIACYGRYWDQLPVSLAITPFRIPGQNVGVPEALVGSDEPLPLEDSVELVELLRDLAAGGRIHVALHGFHHNRFGGRPEYVGGSELSRKTREGKRYLENLLGCRINTFVPPNNAIGPEGLRAIIENDLNLINVPSLLSRDMREQRWRNFAKFLKVQFFQRVRGMRYPYVLQFRDHAELSYHSLTPSVTREKLLDAFRRCLAASGVFVLATHYHAFDKCLRSGETVRDTIDHFATEVLENRQITALGCNDVWRAA